MRKLINLIALLIMASSVTWAQDKKSFTLEDLMPGGNNYYNRLPQNLYGLQWWGDVCINADIEEVKTCLLYTSIYHKYSLFLQK